jgi:heme/copper-type cytochrome/quinol oxidase subunit 2
VILLQGSLAAGWLLMQLLKILVFVGLPVLTIVFIVRAKSRLSKESKSEHKSSGRTVLESVLYSIVSIVAIFVLLMIVVSFLFRDLD